MRSYHSCRERLIQTRKSTSNGSSKYNPYFLRIYRRLVSTSHSQEPELACSDTIDIQHSHPTSFLWGFPENNLTGHPTMNSKRLKLLIKTILGKDLFLRPQLQVPLEHHGTTYGGWAIPAGIVSRESVVYSFGIGEDASWDLGLIAAKGCVVHGFDPTPKSIAWVEREIDDERFVIHPWALAPEDGTMELWLPKDPEHVSASCRPSSGTSDEKITVVARGLASIMKELRHERVDVLKMDIEGAEYPVIDAIVKSDLIDRVGVLLVEFHHWMPAFELDDTRKSLEILAEVGLLPAWVSDSGHEMLFIRQPH